MFCGILDTAVVWRPCSIQGAKIPNISAIKTWWEIVSFFSFFNSIISHFCKERYNNRWNKIKSNPSWIKCLIPKIIIYIIHIHKKISSNAFVLVWVHLWVCLDTIGNDKNVFKCQASLRQVKTTMITSKMKLKYPWAGFGLDHLSGEVDICNQPSIPKTSFGTNFPTHNKPFRSHSHELSCW